MERRAFLAVERINSYLKGDAGPYSESAKATAKKILRGPTQAMPEQLAHALVELVAAIDEEARQPERVPCDRCCGTGYFVHPQTNCHECRGTGYVTLQQVPLR